MFTTIAQYSFEIKPFLHLRAAKVSGNRRHIIRIILRTIIRAANDRRIGNPVAIERGITTVTDTSRPAILASGKGDAGMAQDGVGAAAERGSVTGVAGDGALGADVGVGEPEVVLAAFDGGRTAGGLLDADQDVLEGRGGGDVEGRGEEGGDGDMHFDFDFDCLTC
jgi:hypothetical protein